MAEVPKKKSKRHVEDDRLHFMIEWEIVSNYRQVSKCCFNCINREANSRFCIPMKLKTGLSIMECSVAEYFVCDLWEGTIVKPI